jgi:hypothetical protein
VLLIDCTINRLRSTNMETDELVHKATADIH